MTDEVSTVIAELGDAFDEFKAAHTERLDQLEAKLNRPHLGGDPAARDSDGPAQFKRALKAWKPDSGPDRFDYAEYRSAFDKYLRLGDRVLDNAELKAMSVGVDSEGGYLVTSEMAREVIRAERENSVMRQVARAIPIGAGSLEIPASLTLPETGWVGETGARDVTDAPTVGKVVITPGEVYAMPEVTQKLLDDSEINVEGFVGDVVGQALGIVEDQAFISGNGVNKPRGFTTYPTATTTDAAGTRPFGTLQHIVTGVNGAWPGTDAATYDLLVDVTTALRPAYRRNAVWLMPTAAVAKLMKLKDSQNNPLWQRSTAAGQPATFMGYPVIEAENMPALATGSLSVAFGDFRRGYWIVDRFGTRVLRDQYTNKPFVRYYTTRRVGGGVVDSSAIKLIKFST